MQKIKQLTNIITEFRTQNKLKIFITNFSSWITKNALLILSLFGIEYFYHLSSRDRTMIFIAYILTFTASFIFYTIRYLKQTKVYRQNDRNICQLIEEKYGKQTAVWQLFDLYKLIEENPQSDNSLAIEAVKDYTNRLKQENPAPVIDKSFKKSVTLKTISTLMLTCLLLAIPTMSSAGYRIICFTQEFKPESSHSLKIEPIRQTIMEADSLRINCNISGVQPSEIRFYKKSPGEEKWSELLLTPANNRTVFFIKSVEKNFQCYFASSETTSDTLSVQVTNYPRLTNMQLTVIPPAYTGLPQEKIEQLTGDLTIYAGSQLNFTLKTDHAADSTILNWEEKELTTNKLFNLSHNTYVLNKTVIKPSAFSFLFYTNGRYAPKPVRYRVNILADEFPAVKINFPEVEYQLGEENSVPLLASASDDFAVSRAVAIMKKNAGDSFLGDLKIAVKEQLYTIELPLEKQAAGAYIIQTELSLDKLQMLNGETAEIFVEVFDNDRITGPKSSKSQSIFIKMPTLEELFKDTDESYKEQKDETKKQLDKSKELRDKIKKLSDDLKSNNQQNWDDRAKLDQTVADQKEMLKDLEKMEENIKANMENLEKNSLLSKETMDKYRRLQKMVDELFNEEMKSKLEKLSELSKKDKVSKDELKQLLNNMDEQQKKFQEGLEKTMQILEQIQTEYQLDKLLKTFNDLIEKQENINQSLKQKDLPANVLKDREKDLEKRYTAATDDMKEMAKSDNKLLKKIKDEIQKTSDEFSKDNLPSDMQQQQQETSAEQNDKAGKTGEKVKNKLSDQANKLQALKDSFNKQQKEELDAKIAEQTERVLTLSFMTEDLKNESRKLSAKSSLGKEILAGYADLKNGITQTAENIFAIARQTFFIDNRVGAALGRINQKLPIIKNILESRNFMQAASEKVYLMADLNELFLLLNEARENLKNAESASGLSEMLKKMEELAKQQAELNEKSGEMQGQSGEGGMPMPGMGGKPGSQGKGSQGDGESMSDMMSRLAKEQAAIQDALDKLMGENGMKPGGQGGQGEKPGGEGGDKPGSKGKGKKGSQGSEGEDGDGNRGNAGKLGKKLGGMSQSAQEIVNEMQNKKMTESILKKQDTLLKHMLETVKSLRQERFDNKRESEGGQKSAVNPGKVKLEEAGQSLREKMIRSLKEGYTREYQQKIREYFNSLEK